MFRRAGEQLNAASKRVPASDVVVFTEVPQPEDLPRTSSVVEIVLRNGHLVRVPAGADTDTLRQVLQALQTTC